MREKKSERNRLAEQSRMDAGLSQNTDQAIAYESGFQAAYDKLALEFENFKKLNKQNIEIKRLFFEQNEQLRLANAELVKAIEESLEASSTEYYCKATDILEKALEKHSGESVNKGK